MSTPWFQRLAIAALVSVLLLMFVGATVRVSGSGMGCPDWPKCWGRLIPPTSSDQVDFDHLPIEIFQRKAAWMGKNPAEITPETLREIFNPRHVWIEFFNRLTSLPVGCFSLAAFIASFWHLPRKPSLAIASLISIIIIGVNAWMGAEVVFSGLQPGVITTHLALAMALLGFLVYAVWNGNPGHTWRIRMSDPQALFHTQVAVFLLLLFIILEGIGGSQVRELTDELAKQYNNTPREHWTDILEQSWWYISHRSFSWIILITASVAFVLSRKQRIGGIGPVEYMVFGIVLAQMILGIVMAQFRIFSAVQVLHVGLAAILLALTWLWLFALIPTKKRS